jgi:hypothetical protein
MLSDSTIKEIFKDIHFETTTIAMLYSQILTLTLAQEA